MLRADSRDGIVLRPLLDCGARGLPRDGARQEADGDDGREDSGNGRHARVHRDLLPRTVQPDPAVLRRLRVRTRGDSEGLLLAGVFKSNIRKSDKNVRPYFSFGRERKGTKRKRTLKANKWGKPGG